MWLRRYVEGELDILYKRKAEVSGEISPEMPVGSKLDRLMAEKSIDGEICAYRKVLDKLNMRFQEKIDEQNLNEGTELPTDY